MGSKLMQEHIKIDFHIRSKNKFYCKNTHRDSVVKFLQQRVSQKSCFAQQTNANNIQKFPWQNKTNQH